MKLEVQGASWSAAARRIVDSVDLDAQSGEFVGLIGPNGSGKSSLLRLIYRIYPAETGVIRLDECDIWTMNSKEIARCIAVVAQERASDFDFTVEEIVAMGRTPHKGLFDRDTGEDYAIVRDALERVGVLTLARRNFHTLSGGEKQLVLIARAVAQQAHVLVLDEPTNHLDIRYQFQILDLVRSLRVTTIAAMHDLNLAAEYCDRIYLLQEGRIVIHGQPCEVLTPTRIYAVYGVNAEVEVKPDGRLRILYTGVASPSPNLTTLQAG